MLCRRAWHRLGPLLRTTYTSRKSQGRHASFGVPGGSTNLTYYVLCGGSLTAAMVYAYKTITADSESFEDGHTSMSSKRKTLLAPEAITAAAERVSVEEVVTAAEVNAESVSAPAVSENAVTAGEQTAALMAEVAADIEAVGETPPLTAAVATDVAAVEETPAEDATTESAGMVPDLLTSVKMLVGPPVEIAAASVGEASMMTTVQQITSDGMGLDSTVEIQGPGVPDSSPEVVAEEVSEATAFVVNVEELKSTEVSSGSTEEAPVASEATEEEESAPASAEEDKLLVEVERLVAATEESTSAEEVSAEVLNAADEAVWSDHTLDVETTVEEAADEASAEGPDKVASVKEAGSTLESTEAVDCHCCPPPPGVEVVPPAVHEREVHVHLLSEGAEDSADDSQDETTCTVSERV
ncbi:uncharacterized protein LOC117527019 isoform X2 [Thalassophryne amazonica]|uniref:uncharacterized protein LOC117527019 isoform X2 n=1 Tax=Thalassophryne amazonica TaxID=390379 RepID=UPI00147212A8|nr:uncharacterized protein LOC117527019 isoform X2 [Thalassophryne amazonica]